MTTATVQVSIGGGGNVSGGVTAAFGQTIQPSAVSTAGWFSARWELYDFPPGLTVPAGWSTDASGIYFYAPANPTTLPPVITWPGSGANNWGKLAIRLRVNGNPYARNADGSPNAAFDPTLTDERTVVSVASPTGLIQGICFNETTQFDAMRSSVGALMQAFRAIDPLLGGGTALTVQEEGVTVGATCTTMNFVGNAVTVTGAGATKTVSVTGLFGANPIQGDSLDRSAAGVLTLAPSGGNATSVNIGAAVLSFGTSPAATGILRFPQISSAVFNNGGTDRSIWLTGSGIVTFGDAALTNVALKGNNISIEGSSTYKLTLSGVNGQIRFTAAAFAGAGLYVTDSGSGDAIYFLPIYNGATLMTFGVSVTSAKINFVDAGNITAANLILNAQNGVGGASVGGDLQIGGGTGNTAGFVDFRNQAVATTATAFAGGAAIPATCGFLPVKIGGTIRKLVVVQT